MFFSFKPFLDLFSLKLIILLEALEKYHEQQGKVFTSMLFAMEVGQVYRIHT